MIYELSLFPLLLLPWLISSLLSTLSWLLTKLSLLFSLFLIFLLLLQILFLLFDILFILLPFHKPFVSIPLNPFFIMFDLRFKIINKWFFITQYLFHCNRCFLFLWLRWFYPSEKRINQCFQYRPHVIFLPMIPIFNINKFLSRSVCPIQKTSVT